MEKQEEEKVELESQAQPESEEKTPIDETSAPEASSLSSMLGIQAANPAKLDQEQHQQEPEESEQASEPQTDEEKAPASGFGFLNQSLPAPEEPATQTTTEAEEQKIEGDINEKAES